MGLGLSGILPGDWLDGCFIGRADFGDGPSPILIVNGQLHDLTPVVASIAGAIERRVWTDSDALKASRLLALDAAAPALPDGARLLAPLDFQCVKAAGVTFAVSAIERVIEERARGDASTAAALRSQLEERIGTGIRSVVPGSTEAARLKDLLIADGMWSQYLEVAIGPDAEVFTKAPLLSCVTDGDEIGIRNDSSWNNPEPEIVLLVNAAGETVGATLGNDVNLRDFEGRSALLLGKAKDNNASCAIGPFFRLFDSDFSISDVRGAVVDLHVTGQDGFVMTGTNRMEEISRDPLDIVKQTISQHDYPDGFALFLGTLFAPVQDRDVPGGGFTHKVGDQVTISSPRLGRLSNRVVHCGNAAPWTLGLRAFVTNLAARGLADRV